MARARIVLGCCALVVGLGADAFAAPPDGDRIDQTTRRALDSAYQTDLPGPWGRSDAGGSGGGAAGRLPVNGGGGGGGEAGQGGGTGSGSGTANPRDGSPRTRDGRPSQGDPRRDRDRRYREHQERDEGGGALGGIAQILMWGGVAVVAVLLIVFIVREMSGMTGDAEDLAAKPTDESGEDPTRLAAVVEKPRDDADELARQGRFAEAIHTLLLRTLHELASQNLVRVTRAMTSREVLAKVPLLGDARTALAGLVNAVEVTWFGDDVPSAVDYDRCRQQFEVFATAYRRGALAGAGRAA